MNEITNRTLGNVLLELRAKRDEITALDKRWQATAPGPDQDAIGDATAQLDTDAMDLEKEARELITAATGVPFSLIQEANL
jgi:hypothetical protein